MKDLLYRRRLLERSNVVPPLRGRQWLCPRALVSDITPDYPRVSVARIDARGGTTQEQDAPPAAGPKCPCPPMRRKGLHIVPLYPLFIPTSLPVRFGKRNSSVFAPPSALLNCPTLPHSHVRVRSFVRLSASLVKVTSLFPRVRSR